MSASLASSASFRASHHLAGTALNLALAAFAAAPAAAQSDAVGLPTVSVEGSQPVTNPDYRVEQPTLPKLTEPLLDTPKTISIVPRQMIEDRGATTFSDAIRTVPGISLSAGEAGGGQGSNLTIRGFAARNDIFLDGMRDLGAYYRDPFNYESIEVLKGPDSILFGRGSTGGVVNQVSKMPLLAPFIAGGLTLGTDATKRATADINQPIPGLKGSAIRLNLMAHDSEVAGRDIAENRRYGVAPSVALGIGTPTRLYFGFLHQYENDTIDYGLPVYFGRAAPVRRENFYGFKDGSNYFRADADIATARIEHDFNSAFTIRSQLRYAHYNRDIRATEPQIPAGVTPLTPLSAINVTRNQIALDSTETFLQNQTDLTARFSTGSIGHTVVAGFEVGRETSDPNRYAFAGVPTTPLLSPNPDQPFAGTRSVTTRTRVSADSLGFYALDTVKLSEQWQVIGGVRWDRFDADVRQSVAPATAFSRVDSQVSWRGSLVYKPTANGSLYFAYGTSFNPSAEALALTVATANLAPEKTRTYEVGTKWSLFHDDLLASVAVYRSEKENARVPDPLNPVLNILAGNYRVDGFEIQAVGRITDQWQVAAGYGFQDSVVVSSPRANETGHPLANTPRHTFSLWTTYELPSWKTQFGGGVNYVSSRATSTVPAANGFFTRVDGYATVDLMAKYHLTESVDLQVNIINLFDTYYLDQLHPGHIIPGAGRTALFSTAFRF